MTTGDGLQTCYFDDLLTGIRSRNEWAAKQCAHTFLGCLALCNGVPVLPVVLVPGHQRLGLVVNAHFFVDVLLMHLPSRWKDRDAADPTCYQLTLKQYVRQVWQVVCPAAAPSTVWIGLGRVCCASILERQSWASLLMRAVLWAFL